MTDSQPQTSTIRQKAFELWWDIILFPVTLVAIMFLSMILYIVEIGKRKRNRVIVRKLFDNL